MKKFNDLSSFYSRLGNRAIGHWINVLNKIYGANVKILVIWAPFNKSIQQYGYRYLFKFLRSCMRSRSRQEPYMALDRAVDPDPHSFSLLDLDPGEKIDN